MGGFSPDAQSVVLPINGSLSPAIDGLKEKG
jgi:hypothetical protein